LTPQQSIEAECARRGRREVIDGCARLVLGEPVDASLIRALGGPAADKFFDEENGIIPQLQAETGKSE